MEAMGKYIYCISDADGKLKFDSRNIGKTPAEVRSLNYKDIGAVISDSPMVTYSFKSDNYLAHQRVIEEAMWNGLTVLPVRFGTMAKKKESVYAILEKRYSEFKDTLLDMKGKKELGVKVFWDGEVCYQEMLKHDKNLRDMRDNLASLPGGKTYYQRIEIGRMVERALQDKREREAEKILQELKPHCVDYRINKIIGDKMILNAAFLVNDEQEDGLDQELGILQEKNAERIRINYVGPIPPYNFVEIVVHLNELGID